MFNNKTLLDYYNEWQQNAICKRVRKTVKKKKDKQPFIHKKTKKMRKKTNSGKKTRANTKNGNKNVKSRKRTRFGSRPHGSPKFIQELKTLLFTTLAKSQQNNNYARNQYRNDIDQMHLIRLMENISCPKFVFNDAMAQDCNNRYGTDDYSKKSEPLESELDEVSWWAKSKGMTSEMNQSNKTCSQTWCHHMNDLKEERIPSSLDYCYANSSKARFCKTQSEFSTAHTHNDNFLNAVSKNKLICRINIEFDRMKNDKYCDYLVANSDNMATITKDKNDYSELDNDDFTDKASTKTKIEMKNEFVKACDLVFDSFKDKVFDTVYSDYLASVRNVRRILHH